MKKIARRKMCDHCDGEVVQKGSITSNSVSTFYEHECKKCGKKFVFETSYPVVRFEYEKHEEISEWE